MDRWIGDYMNGCIDAWLNGQVDWCLHEWMYSNMVKWTGGLVTT